jgi:two-component system cell cycle sensor histidine kinase/response regulator CckA
MKDAIGFIDINLNETNPESLQKNYPDIQPGDYVEISITDTGKGIPEEIMERIFDPFFTTKETGKGLGMGLAIVRNIIDSHGGKISVQSTQGSGTTIRFIFPKSHQPALVSHSGKHNN